MKKQIGTKRYNTNNARMIATGIFEDKPTALYLKKNGEYFVLINFYDEIKAQIKPVPEDIAIEFCKANNKRSEYIKALNYLKAEKRQISPAISLKAFDMLKKLSDTWCMPMSETVEKLIIDATEVQNKKIEAREQAIKALIEQYNKEIEENAYD